MKNQTETTVNPVEELVINGEKVVNLTPNLNDGRKKAVVDLDVIQRLSKFLPMVSAYDIIHDFANDLLKYAATDKRSIKGFIGMLQDEMSFHASVNMINEYKPEPKEEIVGA